MTKLQPLSQCVRCSWCSICAGTPTLSSLAPRFQARRPYTNSSQSRRPLYRNWQQQQQQQQQQQTHSFRPYQAPNEQQSQFPRTRYNNQQQPTPPPTTPRLGSFTSRFARRPPSDPDLLSVEEETNAPAPVIIDDRLLAEYTLDEQIRSTHVLVKDVATNKLLDAQPLWRLLRSIDRQTQTIRQLSRPSIDISQLGPHEHDPEPAIVEVTSKQELRERTRAKEQLVVASQKAQRESKPKQIELNWAIGEHDLEMKLKQLHTFLDKGKTVEVLLAAKKRQRKATPEEANQVVKAIHNKLQDVGAKELKRMEGRIGGQALMLVKKT